MSTAICPVCEQETRISPPRRGGSVPLGSRPLFAWHPAPGNPLGPSAGFCPGSRQPVPWDALPESLQGEQPQARSYAEPERDELL